MINASPMRDEKHNKRNHLGISLNTWCAFYAKLGISTYIPLKFLNTSGLNQDSKIHYIFSIKPNTDAPFYKPISWTNTVNTKILHAWKRKIHNERDWLEKNRLIMTKKIFGESNQVDDARRGGEERKKLHGGKVFWAKCASGTKY